MIAVTLLFVSQCAVVVFFGCVGLEAMNMIFRRIVFQRKSRRGRISFPMYVREDRANAVRKNRMWVFLILAILSYGLMCHLTV